MSRRRYGWRPQLPDRRDHKFAWTQRATKAVPVDLRPHCPPVCDQGDLGSCTANAVAGAIEFDRMKQGLAVFTPSRLFIYYNERFDDGTVDSDAGSTIRESIKATNTYGACNEAEWPYDITQFAVKPSELCYADALKDRVMLYRSVEQSLDSVRSVLQAGLPMLMGFTVYESFESDAVAKTGIVPMPAPSESVLGGHAVLAVGDQPDQSRFIMRNSWGAVWGDRGYFYLPYDYLLDSDLASDFWEAQSIDAGQIPDTGLKAPSA